MLLDIVRFLHSLCVFFLVYFALVFHLFFIGDVYGLTMVSFYSFSDKDFVMGLSLFICLVTSVLFIIFSIIIKHLQEKKS